MPTIVHSTTKTMPILCLSKVPLYLEAIPTKCAESKSEPFSFPRNATFTTHFLYRVFLPGTK